MFESCDLETDLNHSLFKSRKFCETFHKDIPSLGRLGALSILQIPGIFGKFKELFNKKELHFLIQLEPSEDERKALYQKIYDGVEEAMD
jgi:hypothetical protein